jgi:bifunctional oligoribonuclease and PAP phosphatase NrnA
VIVTLQKSRLIEHIGESVLVIGHHNADPDALGAAVGVKELVSHLKPQTIVQIVMPKDISKTSQLLINELGLEVFEEATLEPDSLVIVDSGGLNQLGAWESVILKKDFVITLIDHHVLDVNLVKLVDLLIHNENASSTCELVYNLFENYGVTPSVETSKALLAGLMFDTKFFSIGDRRAFETASKLLSNIGDVSEVRSLLNVERDISEKIARIKTAQRSTIHLLNEWLVVISKIGSFQASGARALVSLGADLAIVSGSNLEGLRGSLRSTNHFYNETGIHLGEILLELSTGSDGTGSGHPTAAGYNGPISFDEFNEIILGKLKEKID